MSRLRITPLNIASGVMLTWIVIQLWEGSLVWWYQGVLMIALFLILLIADQYFRVTIRKMSRIWIIEGLFLAIVVVSMWILGLWI